MASASNAPGRIVQPPTSEANARRIQALSLSPALISLLSASATGTFAYFNMVASRPNRPVYPIVPFSDDTPTHPLLVVDFEEVKAGNQEAIDTLFKACSSLGFFCRSASPFAALPIVSSAELSALRRSQEPRRRP